MSGPQRIGAYPVDRELGRGGMGIVYLGRDPRLQRQVAIKVLPDLVAGDPERLARFEREARLLASLNHPNIAAIYGLEEADGHRHLILEYVEGETLAERLGGGALPVGEALEVCRQIAAALEAAHENGVIHRDLKPANVKLTPGGEVKVLDFGLAKGGATESSPDLSQSPTIAYNMTGAGVILGTAAYMSPEQARGKSVDRRTDIWSFGCVLYECLTGRQLFSGETVSDMIARILEREPDWNALPAQTPEKVRELLRRMLEKDSKKRLRDIGDARIELEEVLAARSSSARMAVEERARKESRAPGLKGAGFAWGVAALALVLAAAAMLASGVRNRGNEKQVTRFPVLGLPGSALIEDPGESEISPDGRMVVFSASDSTGVIQLWVRSLDALAVRPIPGTANSSTPFWSSDSRSIGFFADGKLKKVSVVGGGVEALCDAKNGRGGTWNRDDVILFAPDGAGPLFKMPASGGEVEQVTTLDSARHESAHRFPSFLPDGKHFLFGSLPTRAGKHDIWVGSLDSPKRRLLMSSISTPVFAAPGYLIYVRGRGLVAQRFDPRSQKLSGQPIVLPDVPAISQYAGYRAVSASSAGDLAYANGRVLITQLVWLDRSGHAQGSVPMPPGRYEFVGLSSDGKFAAVVRAEGPSECDIWLVDLESGVSTRFTFGPGRAEFPTWSPDGGTVAFQSNRDGPPNFFLKSTNGAAPETTLYASDVGIKNLYSWSADGKSICFEQLDARTGWDIYVLPADRSGPPVPYLRTPFNERWASLSPDGRWMAYTSDESGQLEVYVQSYPQPGKKHRVSTSGATASFWRADGREILLFSQDFQTPMVSDVATGPTFRASSPRPLFRMPPGAQIGGLAPDFQRFLVPLPVSDRSPATITVVQNWAAGLAKR